MNDPIFNSEVFSWTSANATKSGRVSQKDSRPVLRWQTDHQQEPSARCFEPAFDRTRKSCNNGSENKQRRKARPAESGWRAEKNTRKPRIPRISRLPPTHHSASRPAPAPTAPPHLASQADNQNASESATRSPGSSPNHASAASSMVEPFIVFLNLKKLPQRRRDAGTQRIHATTLRPSVSATLRLCVKSGSLLTTSQSLQIGLNRRFQLGRLPNG